MLRQTPKSYIRGGPKPGWGALPVYIYLFKSTRFTKNFRRFKYIKIYLREKAECTGMREDEIRNTGKIYREKVRHRQPRRRLRTGIHATDRPSSRGACGQGEEGAAVTGSGPSVGSEGPVGRCLQEDKASNTDRPSLRA